MHESSWYEVVAPGTALTQGDLIFECPLLTWNVGRLPATPEAQDPEYLKRVVRAFKADVVVMAQACDLERQGPKCCSLSA
jgi:hypothetical protein